MRFVQSVFFFLTFLSFAQNNNSYQIRTIAFYNLENLFDIKNDTLIYDDDRTPEGKDQWTKKRYLHKVNQMSKVIFEIASKDNRPAPVVIGICEVENLGVLADLEHHKN